MPVHDWSKVSANLFHDFHSAWLSEIRKMLNHEVLPEDYFALMEQITGKAIPDVITLHAPVPIREGESSPAGGSSVGGPEAVAVAERPPQVDLLTMRTSPSFSRRQKRIVIRHSAGEVVALIELVSPANKQSADSVATFCHKIEAAIADGIHALVLDLLPPRKHDPNGVHGVHGVLWDLLEADPFELPATRPLLLASYEVNDGIEAYVKPLAVGDTLPAMPLFLKSGWYVEVPLERAYEAAWEGAPRQWHGELPASPG